MSIEKTGVVTFSVDTKPRQHNFRVNVADEKLSIWLEDTVTKEQWRTKELAIPDFVTIDTVIPQAHAKDYAELKHNGPGILSMATAKPNTNSSQFMISIRQAPLKNGEQVVFGRVVFGMDVLKEIEATGSYSGVPTYAVMISDCGQLEPGA